MKPNEKKGNSKKKIEDLDQVKADAGQQKTKPKIGRPTKVDLAAAEKAKEQEMLEGMPDADTFEGLLQFLFQMAADRLGPHWALTETEKQKGSVLLNSVAVKYFPLVGEYGPEVALGVWAASVLLIRLQLTAGLEKMAEQLEAEKAKNDQKQNG